MGKVRKIDENDFYKMNKTFSIWLKKKKAKSFEDLSTVKAMKYFKKFAKKWNKEELQSVYYDEDKLVEKYGEILKQKSKWKIRQDQLSEVSQNLIEY